MALEGEGTVAQQPIEVVPLEATEVRLVPPRLLRVEELPDLFRGSLAPPHRQQTRPRPVQVQPVQLATLLNLLLGLCHLGQALRRGTPPLPGVFLRRLRSLRLARGLLPLRLRRPPKG